MTTASRIGIAITFIIVLGCDLSAQDVTRRALLVGVADYSASRMVGPRQRVPVDRNWQNLGGPINDVALMRDLLVQLYRFQSENIQQLRDHQATRQAILRALDSLVEATKKGDVVLVFLAGHGSHVPNSRSSEPDKLDEAFVPADSRMGARDIRDKELRPIFNSLLDRGARLTVVIDTCFSASGARGLDDGRVVRSVRPDPRDVADVFDAGPLPEDRGALVLAAAQDFDSAYEIRDDDNRIRGAFTWALARAMRDAGPDEPAIDTFLRAQARLRGEVPFQEPVIAGNTEARMRPFLSGDGPRSQRRPVIAIEKEVASGVFVLQGGWANGITVGSVLQPRSGSNVQLEVHELKGIARCEARVVKSSRGDRSVLRAGSLLELVAWAAPPGRHLRISIPRAPDNAIALAGAIVREAASRGIRIVEDPVETTATHVIRWRDGAWQRIARGRAPERLGNLSAAAIAEVLPKDAALFVQVPAPASLIDAIDLRLGETGGIHVMPSPESADYVLAGRHSNGRLEYAWIRPHVGAGSRHRTSLPPRSAWRVVSDRATPLVLRDALMKLRRIHGWLHLESPPGANSHYQLAIRRAGDNLLVCDGRLVGESQYRLVLVAREQRSEPLPQRYFYVFSIDSHGRTVLLFPRNGSVENHLPLDPPRSRVAPPPEIPLGGPVSFIASEPYGVDTFFLLETDEALPNPWSLDSRGVRSPRLHRRSALEQLLADAGGDERAPGFLRIGPGWSIDKVVFESVPRENAAAGRRTSP